MRAMTRTATADLQKQADVAREATNAAREATVIAREAAVIAREAAIINREAAIETGKRRLLIEQAEPSSPPLLKRG